MTINFRGFASTPRYRPWIVPACFLALVAVAVLFFDLSRVPAFNDDFVYRWSVTHVFQDHRLRMFPEDSALPYVQIVWSSLISFGNSDPRILRLTVWPFFALLGVMIYLSAKECGAQRAVSLLATASLLCNPIVLNLASSYMADVCFLALEATCIFAALRWSRTGRGGVWLVVAASLPAMQRQPGAALILGILVAGFFLYRSGQLGWRQLLTLILAFLLPIAALAAVLTASSTNVVAVKRFTFLGLLQSWHAAFLVWPALGFLCLPLLAVSPSTGKSGTATRRIVVYGAMVILVGLIAAAIQRVVFNVIPGDYLGPSGLGPAQIAGIKPIVFHPLLLLLLLVLAGFAAWAEAVTVARRLPFPMKAPAVILVAFAGSQALAFAVSGISDRYYLPVAVPLVILIAGRIGTMVSRAGTLRAATVLALLVGWLYLPGEQDYVAWQGARLSAAQLAYSISSPSRVDAGYEMNGLYWELPIYDSTGTLPPRDPESQYSHAFIGPPCIDWKIYVVRPTDPRPGFAYSSVAPGKVIVAPAPFEHPRCEVDAAVPAAP